MELVDYDFDDDPLLDTLPLVLRQPRWAIHPHVRYTSVPDFISYGLYLSSGYYLWTLFIT
jgi:hypothetical protein